MILTGSGNMETWYSALPAGRYEQLKNCIDLEFISTNNRLFTVNETISLGLKIKNINVLNIKVFNINTDNFYRNNKKEIDTDIDLDGLIAHYERTETFDSSPFISTVRQFDFPEIDTKGVFIVEFIGNGKSSRTVIRKGCLRFHEKTGVSGHIISVYDENNQNVSDCSVSIAGHEYTAGNNGFINIPYTAEPGYQHAIIKTGNFASLARFYHHNEEYQLKAGIYTDREALKCPYSSHSFTKRFACYAQNS